MGKKLILVLVTFTVIATLLAACATLTPPSEPTTAPEPTAHEPTAPLEPTASPIPPPPLGTTDNPIIMGFVPSGTAPEILASGEAIAKQISDLTGYSLKVLQAPSYSVLVE
ncbi:MAG: hypothetical protein NTY23_15290, partial [Chloroflexi bacterium]|nr:hypothetical protein [Chloroflexota bacterium]